MDLNNLPYGKLREKVMCNCTCRVRELTVNDTRAWVPNPEAQQCKHSLDAKTKWQLTYSERVVNLRLGEVPEEEKEAKTERGRKEKKSKQLL